MAIPPNELFQACLGFLPIAVGTQVDLLIFERPPQSLGRGCCRNNASGQTN